METVRFDVIDRSNLPLDLGVTGKYGPLVAAAATLPHEKVICINATTQRELSSVYTSVKLKIDQDERLNGLKIAQRDGKLFIFRAGK